MYTDVTETIHAVCVDAGRDVEVLNEPRVREEVIELIDVEVEESAQDVELNVEDCDSDVTERSQQEPKSL